MEALDRLCDLSLTQDDPNAPHFGGPRLPETFREKRQRMEAEAAAARAEHEAEQRRLASLFVSVRDGQAHARRSRQKLESIEASLKDSDGDIAAQCQWLVDTYGHAGDGMNPMGLQQLAVLHALKASREQLIGAARREFESASAALSRLVSENSKDLEAMGLFKAESPEDTGASPS
ncbi:MAG: hypothetical protein KF833_00770 [Verrucomicrobiae bacterium]|nr:hypothetical protein [Verrucomicrobiae bacterium]